MTCQGFGAVLVSDLAVVNIASLTIIQIASLRVAVTGLGRNVTAAAGMLPDRCLSFVRPALQVMLHDLRSPRQRGRSPLGREAPKASIAPWINARSDVPIVVGSIIAAET